MFFFLPINTDAPVYHFPWATLSMILANCVVFIATLTGDVPVEGWVLTYGEINPLQWVTSNFIHGGFPHLLGNMYFLWGLGLIVEGKIGWLAFLAVYFGIGVSECAIEQLCMLHADGASFGASSIIFGLMAMALVWAPKNEVSIFYFLFILIFIRAGVFEITVMTYALLVIAMELVVFAFMFTFFEFHVGTAALHLLGGVVGFGVGVLMLRRHLVDCEGWDLFSVMKGTHLRLASETLGYAASHSSGQRAKRKRNRTKSRMLTESGAELSAVSPEHDDGLSRLERSRRRILRLIGEKKPRAAFAELQKRRHTFPSLQLDRGPLRKLAQGMMEHQQWDESIALLEEYLERFDRDADVLRVQLALLLLKKQRRPQAALKVLEPVDRQQLTPELRRRMQQIKQRADELIEAGVIELSGQAFSQL